MNKFSKMYESKKRGKLVPESTTKGYTLFFFYSCSSLTEVIPLGKVGFTVKCSELPNQIV